MQHLRCRHWACPGWVLLEGERVWHFKGSPPSVSKQLPIYRSCPRCEKIEMKKRRPWVYGPEDKEKEDEEP